MTTFAAKPRFMVDHMVLKLGKYLRILGYDADWDKSIRTHELILRANTEDRIFLTRNTHLIEQYKKPQHVLTLTSTDPVEQLKAVVLEFQLDTRSFLFSRCIRCNVVLIPVENKESIRKSVHPNVYKRYDHFFTCPHCHTVFWKGSHVRNSCKKLGLATN